MEVRSLIVDAKHVTRSFRSHPKIALSVFLTLAVGVGASVAMLAVLRAVVVAPLPYKDASSIYLFQIRDAAGDSRGWRSWFDARELRLYAQAPAFAQVMWDGEEDVRFATTDGAEHVIGGVLSPNAFDFLGISAILGRVPAATPTAEDSPATFVMSHRYWTRRFGADPGIIGSTFILNDTPSVLVGVMPERFRLDGADVWRIGQDPSAAANGQVYTLRARLSETTSREQAEAQFMAIASQLAVMSPNGYPKRFTVNAVAWPDAVSANLRPSLALMSGAVGLLVLITFSNTISLLLAHGFARRREFAIRTVLGATRGRLARQVMAETLLPSVAAAVTGFVLGYWIIRIAAAEIPEHLLPPEAVLGLDAGSVGIGLCLPIVAAILCALVPSFAASDSAIATSLNGADKGIVGDARPRVTEAFVVMQIVLSVVLVATATVLVRSYATLRATSLGLDPTNVISLRFQLPTSKYPSAAARQQFYRDILSRLATTPGVAAVSTASSLPPYGGIKADFAVTGMEPAPRTLSLVEFCTPGYFTALRVPLRNGRLLDDADIQSTRHVGVVNEAFVRHYAHGAPVLGRTVRIPSLASLKDGRVDNPTFEIVGIIANARNRGVQDAAAPAMYVPYTVTGAYGRSILVRASEAPSTLIPILRQQVWAVDKTVIVTDVRTLSDNLRGFSYGVPKFMAFVLTTFAMVAVLLAGIGIYGLTSHAVSSRLTELSLLLALGADHWRMSRSTFGPPLRVVMTGLVIGLGTTVAAGRFAQSVVPALASIDARVLGLTGVFVVLVAVAAAVGPWRRVRHTDPAAILRRA